MGYILVGIGFTYHTLDFEEVFIGESYGTKGKDDYRKRCWNLHSPSPPSSCLPSYEQLKQTASGTGPFTSILGEL